MEAAEQHQVIKTLGNDEGGIQPKERGTGTARTYSVLRCSRRTTVPPRHN